MSSPPVSEKVIFISDIHIGARISNFDRHKDKLLDRMKASDHVVLIGDIFELLYIPRRQGEKPGETLEQQIDRSVEWLEDFLHASPGCHVHFVLGNHENVDQFRKALDKLQHKYPDRFEWDPQAIRLGDALITHGDLQISKKTDQVRRVLTLEGAGKEQKKTELYAFFEVPAQVSTDVLRPPKKIARLLHIQHAAWDGSENFIYTHQGKNGHRFSKDWVRHVFCGHTHNAFDNLRYGDGQSEIFYHNSGALTKMKSNKEKHVNALEADLENGAIINVRPVSLQKEQMRGR